MRVNFDGSHNNRPKLGISEQALSAAESNLRFRTLFATVPVMESFLPYA
jgi:hypothetical protein